MLLLTLLDLLIFVGKMSLQNISRIHLPALLFRLNDFFFLFRNAATIVSFPNYILSHEQTLPITIPTTLIIEMLCSFHVFQHLIYKSSHMFYCRSQYGANLIPPVINFNVLYLNSSSGFFTATRTIMSRWSHQCVIKKFPLKQFFFLFKSLVFP